MTFDDIKTAYDTYNRLWPEVEHLANVLSVPLDIRGTAERISDVTADGVEILFEHYCCGGTDTDFMTIPRAWFNVSEAEAIELARALKAEEKRKKAEAEAERQKHDAEVAKTRRREQFEKLKAEFGG